MREYLAARGVGYIEDGSFWNIRLWNAARGSSSRKFDGSELGVRRRGALGVSLDIVQKRGGVGADDADARVPAGPGATSCPRLLLAAPKIDFVQPHVEYNIIHVYDGDYHDTRETGIVCVGSLTGFQSM